MADLSDVEQALVNMVAATVYPNGTSQPSRLGAPVRVYRGWPDARDLDKDIQNGVVNLTVFSERGGRRTTRYPHITSPAVIPTPTLTVSTAEPTVTFAGAAGVPCLAGVRTNTGAWAVSVTAGMAPADVANAIAAAIVANPDGAPIGEFIIGESPIGATTPIVSGGSITLSPSDGIQGRVVGVGTQITEVRRQVQPIRLTIWSPSVALRDTAASVVDAAVGSIDWLTLADGTGGRITYRADFVDDVPSKDLLWRRDLCYDVEYPTTVTNPAYEALFIGGTVSTAVDTVFVWGDVLPTHG